jgi:hypothetical protein
VRWDLRRECVGKFDVHDRDHVYADASRNGGERRVSR